jgi:hypothetical protein
LEAYLVQSIRCKSQVSRVPSKTKSTAFLCGPRRCKGCPNHSQCSAGQGEVDQTGHFVNCVWPSV